MDDGKLRLLDGHESVVWSESGRRLHDACDRISALKSRVVIVENDGVPRMENGEPITDDIMAYWGWRRDGDQWVTP